MSQTLESQSTQINACPNFSVCLMFAISKPNASFCQDFGRLCGRLAFLMLAISKPNAGFCQDFGRLCPLGGLLYIYLTLAGKETQVISPISFIYGRKSKKVPRLVGRGVSLFRSRGKLLFPQAHATLPNTVLGGTKYFRTNPRPLQRKPVRNVQTV